MSYAISSDDPRAVEKLQEKLERCQKNQERMKSYNAYYRRHGTMVGYPGMPDDVARSEDDSIRSRRYGEKLPYQTFDITNNGAEIRRIKKRIEQLTRDKEVGFVGWKFAGGEAVVNNECNRLQLIFDDKPNEQQRMELKRNGFLWSPSQGAWQRLLNIGAICAAARLRFVWPENGESPLRLQPKAPQKSGPER